jgi:hypothetical protein
MLPPGGAKARERYQARRNRIYPAGRHEPERPGAGLPAGGGQASVARNVSLPIGATGLQPSAT